LPNKVVLLADGGEGQHWLAQHIESLRLMAPLHGQAAAYVCQNFHCEFPVTEAEQLARILDAL
jgi:uncharacterized protein YyaL (SSP411 family)